MSGVIVLNASYEQLHVVSIPHAIRMLVREVAVVEEAHDGASIDVPRFETVELQERPAPCARAHNGKRHAQRIPRNVARLE